MDIHFATGKAEILPESDPIIDEIVALPKKKLDLRIGVEDHTDNTGTPAANKTLSEARARAVAAAFVAVVSVPRGLFQRALVKRAPLLTTELTRVALRTGAWRM